MHRASHFVGFIHGIALHRWAFISWIWFHCIPVCHCNRFHVDMSVLQFLAVRNKTSMNICIQVFAWACFLSTEWKACREMEGACLNKLQDFYFYEWCKETDWEHFHLLVHFLNPCYSWGCVGAGVRMWECNLGLLHGLQKRSYTRHHHCIPVSELLGSWSLEWKSGMNPRKAIVRCLGARINIHFSYELLQMLWSM